MKKLIVNLAILCFIGMGVTLIYSEKAPQMLGFGALDENLRGGTSTKKSDIKGNKPAAKKIIPAYKATTKVEQDLLRVLDAIKSLSENITASPASPLSSPEVQKEIKRRKDEQAKLSSKAGKRSADGGRRWSGGRGGSSSRGGGSFGRPSRGGGSSFGNPFGGGFGRGGFGGGYRSHSSGQSPVAYHADDHDDYDFDRTKNSFGQDNLKTPEKKTDDTYRGYSAGSKEASEEKKALKASYESLTESISQAQAALKDLSDIKKEKSGLKDRIEALEESDAVQRLNESLRSIQSKKSSFKAEKLSKAHTLFGGKAKSSESNLKASLKSNLDLLMLAATAWEEEIGGADIDGALQSQARSIIKDALKQKQLDEDSVKEAQSQREAALAKIWAAKKDVEPTLAGHLATVKANHGINAMTAAHRAAPVAAAGAVAGAAPVPNPAIAPVEKRNESIEALRKKLLPLPKHDGALQKLIQDTL